jgi:hypothetical protein
MVDIPSFSRPPSVSAPFRILSLIGLSIEMAHPFLSVFIYFILYWFYFHFIPNILSHIDPLLGNDQEISSYTIAVAM